MEGKGGKKRKLVITGRQYPVWGETPEMQSGMDVGDCFPKAVFSKEPIVTVQKVEASFYQRGGAFYWLYDEELEGHPHPWRTRVKYKGNVLEVTRRGEKKAASMLLFEAGKTYRTEYPTPFGSLLLDVVTESVEFMAGQAETVELKICYILEHDGKTMGKYELIIQG